MAGTRSIRLRSPSEPRRPLEHLRGLGRNSEGQPIPLRLQPDALRRVDGDFKFHIPRLFSPQGLDHPDPLIADLGRLDKWHSNFSHNYGRMTEALRAELHQILDALQRHVDAARQAIAAEPSLELQGPGSPRWLAQGGFLQRFAEEAYEQGVLRLLEFYLAEHRSEDTERIAALWDIDPETSSWEIQDFIRLLKGEYRPPVKNPSADAAPEPQTILERLTHLEAHRPDAQGPLNQIRKLHAKGLPEAPLAILLTLIEKGATEIQRFLDPKIIRAKPGHQHTSVTRLSEGRRHREAGEFTLAAQKFNQAGDAFLGKRFPLLARGAWIEEARAYEAAGDAEAAGRAWRKVIEGETVLSEEATAVMEAAEGVYQHGGREQALLMFLDARQKFKWAGNGDGEGEVHRRIRALKVAGAETARARERLRGIAAFQNAEAVVLSEAAQQISDFYGQPVTERDLRDAIKAAIADNSGHSPAGHARMISSYKIERVEKIGGEARLTIIYLHNRTTAWTLMYHPGWMAEGSKGRRFYLIQLERPRQEGR